MEVRIDEIPTVEKEGDGYLVRFLNYRFLLLRFPSFQPRNYFVADETIKVAKQKKKEKQNADLIIL
jgi:hypothetical protein